MHPGGNTKSTPPHPPEKALRLLTVINASAAVTLLEQRPEQIQALSGIWTHDLCNASAVLYQWAIKATWEQSYTG